MTRIKLSDGDCSDKSQIEELVDYLNGIHAWGIGTYGPNAESDVKACIDAGESGHRTSDYHEWTRPDTDAR